MAFTYLSSDPDGMLTVSGLRADRLAQRFATPLLLMDEDTVIRQMRLFRDRVRSDFTADSRVAYAMKVFCCKEMGRLAGREGLWLDAVSRGEMFTALQSGFPAGRILFHGNNKTDADLRFCLDHSIGLLVVDNPEEPKRLVRLARGRQTIPDLLIRFSPELEDCTHKKIMTGGHHSKFGMPRALVVDTVRRILQEPLLHLVGFHCHIGSQITKVEPFVSQAEALCDLVKTVYDETGFRPAILDIGGGLGVGTPDDHTVWQEILTACSAVYRRRLTQGAERLPLFILEPGRSIVAEAGVTLYRAGSVKPFAQGEPIVSIDGGMTDNPRYTLYGARYEVMNASRSKEKENALVTLAGRCCESGDLIGEHLPICCPVPGELVAVKGTGAYNYAMASQYNRLAFPAVVLLHDETARVIVRRQTMSETLAFDR